jgi:hypothetical protein
MDSMPAHVVSEERWHHLLRTHHLSVVDEASA